MISDQLERTFDQSEHNPVAARPEGRITFDDRLNHILESATRLIAQAGYENASMRAVAKAADVSLAGLYHYFDSKEKMLFLIQFRAFNSLLSNLREKLHGVDDCIEQLNVMVRAHVDYFAANMAALKVCSHELDALTGSAYEETRKIRRAYYDETRAIIDRIFDRFSPHSPLDRHIATMTLFGSLNWLYRWYHPKEGKSPGAIARQITAQFLHGIIDAERPEQETARAPS